MTLTPGYVSYYFASYNSSAGPPASGSMNASGFECVAKACPNSAYLSGNTCVCNDRFIGDATWNSNDLSWVGSCTAVPCPNNSTVIGSTCVCDEGFNGGAAWNATDSSWSGSCTPKVNC